MLEGYEKTIKESFNKVFTTPKSRYKEDVEKLVNAKSAQVFKMAVNDNEKAFEMALGMFLLKFLKLVV